MPVPSDMPREGGCGISRSLHHFPNPWLSFSNCYCNPPCDNEPCLGIPDWWNTVLHVGTGPQARHRLYRIQSWSCGFALRKHYLYFLQNRRDPWLSEPLPARELRDETNTSKGCSYNACYIASRCSCLLFYHPAISN